MAAPRVCGFDTAVLLCRLFRHMVLDILHGIDLRNTGHKAPTYRQTEQCSHLQKSKLHADSNGIATRWLRAVLKLLLHRGCNLKQKKVVSPSTPDKYSKTRVS
jgi:hypothetical protein